jgi:hypothetical protein
MMNHQINNYLKRTIPLVQQIIFILVISCLSVYSQDFRKTATSGFTFLEIPATARVAALGEAANSLSDMNAEGIFSNPGSLGFMEQTHSFSTSYANWFADIKNYAAGYSYNSSFGVFGVSFVLFDYGTFERTVKGGGQKIFNSIGSFSANSIAAGLTYSRRLTDKFAFGFTAKYVQEKIDIYTASNILVDGGVLYYTGLGSLRIAASIHNFGVNSKFINEEFRMPLSVKLGASAEVLGNKDSEYRVTLIAEAIHPNDGNEKISIGTELGWQNTIILRGGYKFFYDEETYSIGFGINPKLNFPVTVDFAFADYGRLGNILRFTLQLGYF